MPKIAFESAEMNMNSRTWNSRTWSAALSEIRADTERLANEIDLCLGNGGNKKLFAWDFPVLSGDPDTECLANEIDLCLGNGGNKKSFAGDSPALSADPVADLQLATVRKLREVRCAMLVFLSLYECCWHFS